jgi:hypothetical protein
MYAYGLIKAMPPRQSHLPQARATHIPDRIQQEMDRHMQQTLPANLQYYQKSGGYVPPHIQQQLAQHMEKSMPNHLKQYINPYMQQNVVSQHLTSMPGGQSGSFSPTTHASPSFIPNQQHLNTFAAGQPQGMPEAQPALPQAEDTQPSPAPQPEVTSSPQEPYAFITNPEVTEKSPPALLALLSGKSLWARIAVFGGGLVVLLIIFSILKGLLAGSFNSQPFLAVLHDQQELIHLTSTQSQSGQAALPATYQNFIATTQVTVKSAQSQLLAYLLKNKQKISTTELDYYSAAIDSQLTAAETTDTYTATFQGIMSNQLASYRTDLRRAYAETSGKKGHEQLSYEYNQATLLVKQFNQAGSAPSN